MLDALHSITARPVGAAGPVAPGGRRSYGLGGGDAGASAFPGLGEYGRAAQEKRNAAPENAASVKNAEARNNEARDAGGALEGDALHLSPEAQAQLRELRQRDAEVRAHEKAHMAAGGQYVAGGPSYEYQQGPDGRQYAIGGHVSIDASAIPDDPEASAAKARQVRRAALAPGEPSVQDRAVAAKASAQETRAAREKQEESQEDAGGVAGAGNQESARDAAPSENLSRGESARATEVAAPGESAGSRETSGSPGGRSGIAHALMRAAETYAAMAQRGVMPTALAPGGTGISLQI
ncbi:putative metalloprotease CJM1_0395 family protein [Desulfovibrio sp.]|uniref:putative metalloprotease CJM1_0395 family protein n=1 Tax=Desulfovibrio sp. TaxID=885 RepID=UPI0023C2576E|nr:putative metalloprotease CJM1_0395 family protein [Desulfovibrio sp.]MDE7241853.1 catalase [Desulfovibrio sp.]